MSEQHTVVDATKATAQPVVTESNAPGDVDPLDQLLAEYDQGTKPAATVTPPETKPTPQPDEVVQKVRLLESQVNEWAADKNKRAISETIEAIRGDVPAEVFDDDMIEGWLDVQARKDPRLLQAFVQREANPKKWSQVRTELGKNLAKKVGKLPDAAATEDRHAVAAAVRGASTKVAPEAPANYGKMPAAEGRKDVIEKYGFDPGWR